ncbi:T9SS type A sorting domain-containing protein [Fluviicola sp.]|uniref:T9SS type A sorting domain-containing protein n=1 Tax=Fluviicola sp. TaxID=1917219 RepID=UPI00261A6005|nr:T9SS type A sorting domain-containing protein [Fluviicola sp.]
MKRMKLQLALLSIFFLLGFQSSHAQLVSNCFPPLGVSCKYNKASASVTLNWSPVLGATSYTVYLHVGDPMCCPNYPGFSMSVLLPTMSTSMTIPLSTYPCFSWSVRTECGKDNYSAYTKQQCMCVDEPPCTTFDGSSPAGNWVPTGVTTNYTAVNPLDGTNCLTIGDLSGGSWYTNTVDYNNLGQNYLGQCLCFDVSLEKAEPAGGGLPYNPRIYLSDGTNSIMFVANAALNPGSGWVTVCAPIAHCSGGVPPSNADGTWVLATPGMTCADFDNVIDNGNWIGLTPEVNSYPTEIKQYDNICVRDCRNGCNSNFTLNTAISSSSGTASASVVLDFANPTSTYIVDWGDGAITGIGSHTYGSSGFYNVCVTEITEKGEECRTCVGFCYEAAHPNTIPGLQNRSAKPTEEGSIRELNRIAEEELKTSQVNGGYQVLPNPAKDYVIVQTELAKEEAISLELVDMGGKVVASKSGVYERGGQKIELDTKRLSNGMYVLKVRIGDVERSSQVSIIK